MSLEYPQILELFLKHDKNIINCKYYANTILIIASSKGYAETVKLLLKASADPNIIAEGHDNGHTALIKASLFGHLEIIRLLLEYGAMPDLKDPSYNHTALIDASRLGHFQIAELLLLYGANPNIRSSM